MLCKDAHASEQRAEQGRPVLLAAGSILLPVQAWHSACTAPVQLRAGVGTIHKDSTSQGMHNTENPSMLMDDFHTCPGAQVAYWA